MLERFGSNRKVWLILWSLCNFVVDLDSVDSDSTRQRKIRLIVHCIRKWRIFLSTINKDIPDNSHITTERRNFCNWSLSLRFPGLMFIMNRRNYETTLLFRAPYVTSYSVLLFWFCHAVRLLILIDALQNIVIIDNKMVAILNSVMSSRMQIQQKLIRSIQRKSARLLSKCSDSRFRINLME